MKIFKYELALTDRQFVRMPCFAEPLCIQMQFGVPMLWVKVTPENAEFDCEIVMAGTGHELPALRDFKYMGTTQHGVFVWHWFVWHCFVHSPVAHLAHPTHKGREALPFEAGPAR